MSEHRRIESPIQWENLGLRLRTVIKHTPKKSRILVVGSGIGELANLMRLHGYKNITTLDIDPRVNPDVLHDIRKPFPVLPMGAYDAVIAFHVLEHIPFDDFPRALVEINRVLHVGGLFFFGVPYRCWFLSSRTRFCRWKMDIGPYRKLKHFKGNSQHYWEVSKDHPERHVKTLIEMWGFKIEKEISTVLNPVELFLICKKERKK